jgi:hypothetical protein
VGPVAATMAAGLLVLGPAPRSHAGDDLGDPVVAAVGDMACDPSDPAFHGGVGGTRACAEQRTSDAVLADTSVDEGSWHIIGMNGNCQHAGGCGTSSAQTAWLQTDLASTTQLCIAAYWHQPMFTGLDTGKNLAYRHWWDALYAAHADVVLNGHVHDYQRYAPMAADATPDVTNGITEYVVGTGGEKEVALQSTASPQPAAYLKSFGYLRITLLPAGWTADFVDPSGTVLDSSSGACHPKQ